MIVTASLRTIGPRWLLCQCIQHGVAQPALREVVLDGDDCPRLARRRHQRAGVHRLERVQVDHARVDSLGCQRIGGLDRFVEGDAGSHQGDGVVVRAAHGAAAANVERFARLVDDRRFLARGPHEDDPAAVGSLREQGGCLVRVRWIEDGAAVHGPQRGKVLQGHLRRPVLADAHPGVRSRQHDVGAADRRHAHEVVGTRQECGKGGGERPPATDLEANCVGEQHAARQCRPGRSAPDARSRTPRYTLSCRPRRRWPPRRRARCRARPARRRRPCASPPWCRSRRRAGSAARCSANRCGLASKFGLRHLDDRVRGCRPARRWPPPHRSPACRGRRSCWRRR